MSAAAAPHPDRVAPLAEHVAGVWRDVLKTGELTPADNFFGLGGHSLLAAQVSVRLGTAYGLPSDQLLLALFGHPTLADFTAEVDQLVTAAGGAAAGARVIPAQDRSKPFPLPRGQERVWFLEQLDEVGGEYDEPLALRLKGALDVAALRAALTGIVERHDVLRTSVVVVDDRPMGVLRPVSAFALTELDVLHQAAPDVAALVQEHTGERLDLAAGLPIRARLLRLAPDDHLLCVTVHHIAIDGWSYHVFFEELAAGYAGQTPEAPPVSFHDLAVWQEAEAAEADADGLAYWRDTLAGLTPFELPTDRPRGNRRHNTTHTRVVTVPEPVAAALERIAATRDATLFMVVLAACQVLLHRHTGRTDVTVGTTAAERSQAESKRMIGLFVNMLVLRGDVSGNPTFDALVERVRDLATAAYAHQGTPFDRLVEVLAPERDLSRTPLFQVMVKLNSQPLRSPELAGIAVDRLPVALEATKYDAVFDFKRVDGGLECLVMGDASLYDAETVDRWGRHLVVLLGSLAAAPQDPVADVPMVTADEAAAQRALTGPAPTDFPDACLHELVEAQVARTPDLVAVVDDTGSLTYRQLGDRADRIAAALRDAGVGPDVPVAVMLHRSTDLLAGLLGILKAGGAYVPIETDTPVARVATLLADARCPVALVEPDAADVVTAAGGVPLLVADAAAHALRGRAAMPPENLSRKSPPESLCAIYFTSGSTGAPKGVACPHRGWVNRMWWMQRRHGLKPGDTVLHKTTLTFDDAAVELFWPLLVGGRVAMLAPGLHRDPRAILDAAARFRAVHVNFVPSMLELVLETLRTDDQDRLAALRSALSSGEALRPAIVGRFRDAFGDRVSLDNTWGATEVSIDSTFHVCGPADAASPGAVVSLGRPFDNNDVVVLDDHGRPAPVGVPGELCIGGVGLARGYLNDPARTAAAFVPHPYRPGERLYRTGDQGRMRADGTLEFGDRRDNQVKIRGVRIELGEVETALRQHPAVTDAAVVAWQATPSDKRLAGYAVLAAGAAATAADLRQFLESQLPSYAVPGSLSVVPELPRLASGKLDRRALPAPDPESTRGVPYRAPATVTEEAIAAMWAEVLGLSRVGADDNFFAVGGHSLLATRVVTRMRQAFALDLPLSVMFERPTVAAAAAHVEALVLAEVESLTEAEAQHLAATAAPPH